MRRSTTPRFSWTGGKYARGEDVAEQFNAVELRKLSAGTGRPILAIGAHHGQGGAGKKIKPEALEAMDAEDCNGLRAQLEPVSYTHLTLPTILLV